MYDARKISFSASVPSLPSLTIMWVFRASAYELGELKHSVLSEWPF